MRSNRTLSKSAPAADAVCDHQGGAENSKRAEAPPKVEWEPETSGPKILFCRTTFGSALSLVLASAEWTCGHDCLFVVVSEFCISIDLHKSAEPKTRPSSGFTQTQPEAFVLCEWSPVNKTKFEIIHQN